MLKDFEWFRNPAGYQLAWLARRGKAAYWIQETEKGWSEEQDVDRAVKLHISTTEYQGEKRVAASGIYIASRLRTVNTREVFPSEVIRPFAANEVVFLNLLRTARTPKGWLDFTNKYGMIGHSPILHRWHMSAREKKWFIYDVEHEGEWHGLVNVLSQIYYDYAAIKKRDSKYLSKIIKWFSNNQVHEYRGIEVGGHKIQPSIAMRGKYQHNAHYFDHMKRPDVFVPAAFSLRDSVNRYLEKSLSLELSFDPASLEFTSSLRYGSLGAALVAEAIDFMAGHFDARQCEVCGSWFRIGADQMRRDRIFCSNACKMRDYRARKSSGRISNRRGRRAQTVELRP
jgi:hypothetical protein